MWCACTSTVLVHETLALHTYAPHGMCVCRSIARAGILLQLGYLKLGGLTAAMLSSTCGGVGFSALQWGGAVCHAAALGATWHTLPAALTELWVYQAWCTACC
jgi:hypothetical protein